MNHLVKVKILFSAFLFPLFAIAETSPAIQQQASFADISKKERPSICEEQFIQGESFLDDVVDTSHIDSEPVSNLIARLDYAIAEQGLWRRRNPILLRELYEFFRILNSRLSQKISLSDSLRIQQELNSLVLPWVFWRSNKDSTGKEFLSSIKDPEKNLKQSLQEWGEASLGRSLSEREVQALKEAYNYTLRDIEVEVQYFGKQEILKAAGFSEQELDQLGRKKVLRGRRAVVLELPRRASTEAYLRVRGYNSAYIKGMGKIEELIAVGERQRQKKVNPYEDHMSDLGQKLREYIAYMERGVRNSKQREKFENLKKYTEIIITEKGVTYEQFLTVSLRLADILSTKRSMKPVWERMSKFPEIIAMPTTAGIVSFIPLNTMTSEGIKPIGLVNKKVFVHGKWKEPNEVIEHDTEEHIKKSKGTSKNFYDKWKKRRKNYSVERGQNVELAYHILTHEIFAKIIIGLEGVKREKTTFVDHPEDIEENIKEGIQRLISETPERELREIIDLSGDPDQKIQEVADDFMEVFDEIQGTMRK